MTERITDYSDKRLTICRDAQRTDIVGVRCALKQGADPNIIDVDGSTALIHAASRGSNNVVKVLLAHGANIDAQDDTGQTALIYAARLGYTRTVQLLVAAKADLELRDKDGRSVFDFHSYNDAEIAPLLDNRRRELAAAKEAEEKRRRDEFWQGFGGNDVALGDKCRVRKPLKLKKPRP